jgi:hypothetical protein
MNILESVQKNYPAINNAAGEFLTKLTGVDIKKDIILAAEMAGLMLLRASPANQKQIGPGTVVLGAVPDEQYQTMNHFVFSFAASNRLNPKEMDISAIPADAKNYLPELTRFEKPFYEVCNKHGIENALFPFTAAAAAGKLVLAGNELKLLEPKVGLAILVFHIIAGSKTFPYPVPAEYPQKSD